jgi:hypothetical protein
VSDGVRLRSSSPSSSALRRSGFRRIVHLANNLPPLAVPSSDQRCANSRSFWTWSREKRAVLPRPWLRAACGCVFRIPATHFNRGRHSFEAVSSREEIIGPVHDPSGSRYLNPSVPTWRACLNSRAGTMRRFLQRERQGKTCVLLYCGDHHAAADVDQRDRVAFADVGEQ